MKIKTVKKDSRRGGGALLDKYGPGYFKKLAKKRARMEKQAKEFYKKHNKK